MVERTVSDGIHGDQPVRTAGAPLERANAAVIMLHGRGATAEGMLGMVREFPTESIAYRAIQAAGNTWYPQSFMAPIEANEPALTSALRAVHWEIEALTDTDIALDRIALLGFSQGACLAAEYAARNARRYGGVMALSGGLIGPEGLDREYEGSFDGMPAFFGCSDVDPHIPLERVKETTAIYSDLGANVDERIYEGMGHTVNQDELAAVRELLTSLSV